jgi:ATP-dependent exoDNAse (exonuclease V) beta subunit
MEFGAEVHALLAEAEWGDPLEVSALESRWRERGVHEDAVAEARACLLSPELAGVWQPPARRCELWRERAFEIVLDEAWVTGVFDRVVIERDSAGRAVRGTVFDFKTDAVDDRAQLASAVQRHAAQLNLYRRVVAVLAGVPTTAIAAELVFTRVCVRVRVRPETA